MVKNITDNPDLDKIDIHYKTSKVMMTTFNGRVCTEYKSLHKCNQILFI